MRFSTNCRLEEPFLVIRKHPLLNFKELENRPCILRSAGRLLVQKLENNTHYRRRNTCRIRDRIMQMLLAEIWPRKRHVPGKYLVPRHSQRVEICLHRGRLVSPQLRSHLRFGAASEHKASCRIVKQARHTKVCKLPVRGKLQYVSGLDVMM